VDLTKIMPLWLDAVVGTCNLLATLVILHCIIAIMALDWYCTGMLGVRYHCGGWSEEVNSCILISYIVYLLPKHSLGYYLHRQQHLCTHIRITIFMAQSPCFLSPLADFPLLPLLSPLLTWKPS
jgi:hypothetical protein